MTLDPFQVSTQAIGRIAEATGGEGKTFTTKKGTIGYYDEINSIRVIINSATGQVVTTIPGIMK